MARKKNKPVNLYVVGWMVVFLVGAFAMAALMRHSAEAGQGRITDRSRICMLQDTVQPKPGLTHVYHGKKYYLCCAGCLSGFKQDPGTHSHAIDPVGGELVDKADAPAYAYQGRAYFFSSVANMIKFGSDPEKFVARASSKAAAR